MLTGLVWKDHEMRLCWGLGLGAELPPALAAGGEAAPAPRLMGLSGFCSRYGITHVGSARPKSGVLPVIFQGRRSANTTPTGDVWGKGNLQVVTSPLVGVQ